MATTGFKTIPGSKLTTNDTSATEELGSVRLDVNGGMWTYGQANSATVVGTPNYHNSSTTGLGFVYTPAQARAIVKKCAGVAQTAISASNFGWFQQRGVVANAKLTASLASKGLALIGVSTVFSTASSALYHRVAGFAIGSASGSQLANGLYLNTL